MKEFTIFTFIFVSIGLSLILQAFGKEPSTVENKSNQTKIRLNAPAETGINEGYKIIQDAVNALPSDGGVIELSNGVYVINRSIWLRSGVTLRGSGAETILRKLTGYEANILEAVPKETSAILVDHPEQFHKGEEVGITDNQHFGWSATHAIVLGVENGRLLLNRGVWADYRPEFHGVVAGLFPMITASNSEDITVENLTIEAEPDKQPVSVCNFTFSGIHFDHVSKAHINHVAISGYPGDGISIQGGSGCQIIDNVVQGCLEFGYHAGGGLTDSLFENNQATNNGSDGFYFCSNVQVVTVKGNLFKNNKGHGIGGLGDWGDTKNVVETNQCIGNGGGGIVALNGSGNQIIGNLCSANSQHKPGEFPGILLLNTTDTIVRANRCIEETQSWGIMEIGTSDRNQITENYCSGNLLGGLQITGPNTTVCDNEK